MIDRSQFWWEILCTDADFGIDGGLYVSDWVAGWNKTGKGRIYRAHDPALDSDPTVLQTKKLISEGMAGRSVNELVELLAHPDMRVRQEAQFALVDKNAENDLSKVASTQGNALARLHAIWGLGQLARKSASAVDALKPLLNDGDAEIRAQIAKVLGDARVANARAELISLLADPSPRPRFFAALAVAKIGDTAAIDPVLQMIRSNPKNDVYLRHAGVMALQGIVTREPKAFAQLQTAAKDDSSALRITALLVMRRLQRPEVAQFLDDTDPLIVLEAARAINDESIQPALPKLAALISKTSDIAKWPAGTPELPGPRDAMLRRVINANFRLGNSAAATALADLSQNQAVPERFRAEAVDLLGDWSKPSGRERITGLWRPMTSREPGIAAKALQPAVSALLQSDSELIKIAAAKTAARLDLKETGGTLYELLANDRQAARVRVEALKALAALKDRRISDALKLALATDKESLRNEATKIQALLRPKDATAQIRTLLDKGSLKEKQNAFLTLGTMTSSAPDDLLTQWMDKLIARQVAPELQLDLLDAANKRNNPAIKEKLRRFEESRDPKDDMRSFRECLVGGDAKEGRVVFFEKAEASCVRCHKIDGEGGEVGPNLAGIGAKQRREYILESIVFPNKQIAQGFDSVLVTTKNEVTYAGTLKSETDTMLEINSPEDGMVQVKKADIKTRQRGLSAMPEELRQILTKQDLRNLVEFLSTAN